LSQLPLIEPGFDQLADTLRIKLEPGQGRRPGRPGNREWIIQRKVSMSAETFRALENLAELASNDKRKVTPMQVAALLLEEATGQYAQG